MLSAQRHLIFLSIEHSIKKHIEQLLKKFKRRITVLEVGRSATPYAFLLCYNHNCIWVSLLLEGNGKNVVERIKSERLNTITVLNPRSAQYDVFFNLGRCEHFDVVIVHDIFDLFQVKNRQLIDALIKLGDYVFIETSHKDIESELRKRRVTQIAVHQMIHFFYQRSRR